MRSHETYDRFPASRWLHRRPAPQTAPQVGRWLSASLVGAASRGLGWSLGQLGNGDFEMFTWPRGRREDVAAWRFQKGPLMSVLVSGASLDKISISARSLGLPTNEAGLATTGALLLALFAANEPVKAKFYLEFCPWNEPELRYRLRYRTVRKAYEVHLHFRHASSLERLELITLEFLAECAVEK